MITGDPVAVTAVPAVALATGTAVALALALALALAHTIAVASTAGVTGLGRPAPGRVIATVDTATATTGTTATTATAVGTVVGRRLAPGRGLQSSAAGGVMTTRVARLRRRQLLWSR